MADSVSEGSGLAHVSDRQRRRRRWEYILFAVIWLILVAAVTVSAVRGAWDQGDAAAQYLPVDAMVTKAEVVSLPANRGARSANVSFQPRLTYRYSVGGVSYTSSRFYLEGAGVWTTLDQAKKIVSGDPVGSTIQVYYDPANPANSAFDLQATSNLFWAGLIVFWLFGIAMLLLGLRGSAQKKHVEG